MTSITPNSPVAEQKHLETNAWVSIMLGVVFSLQSSQDALETMFSGYPALSIALNVLFFVLLITLFAFTVKAALISKKMHWRSVWHQYYEDEYLNHINLSGYKWAFNIVLLFLFCSFLAFDSTLIQSESFDIANFAQFSIGVAGLCYGLRIFVLAKGSDDE